MEGWGDDSRQREMTLREVKRSVIMMERGGKRGVEDGETG